MSLRSRFFSRRTLLADRFLYMTPQSVGIDSEEVEISAPGGVTLRGWFFFARGSDRLAVFCSGNSGNVSCHLEYVRMVHEAGCSVLAFDYRGFGRSDGEPDLRRVVDDVSAACAWARERAAGRSLILYGLSLGACAAVAAAGSRRFPIAAIVIEGVSDLRAMLGGLFSTGSFGPTWIHNVVDPSGVTQERRRVKYTKAGAPRTVANFLAAVGTSVYPFAGKEPRRFAAQLHDVAVFVIHGVEDSLLPFEGAIEFYDALSGPRRLWLIAGAGHAQEPAMSHRAEYIFQLRDFILSCPHHVEDVRAVADDAPQTADEEGSASARRESRALRTTVEDRRLVQAITRTTRSSSAPSSTAAGDGSASVRRLPDLRCHTLGDDAEPDERLDPVARAYRDGGYRDAFRRLVAAVNQMDFTALEEGLDAFLALERKLPFDFMAAVYCLRAAVAGEDGIPGWPRVDPEQTRRCLRRFLSLWHAHEELPGENVKASPAAWAGRVLAESPSL